MTKKKKTLEKLPWEYCECGCHQNILHILGLSFSSLMSWSDNAAGQKIPGSDMFRLSEPSHSHKYTYFRSSAEEENYIRAKLRNQAESLVKSLPKNLKEAKKYL